MQGVAAPTDCCSLALIVPWSRNPVWKKYAKSRVHPSFFRSPAPVTLSISSSSQRGQQDFGPPTATPPLHLAATSNQFLGCGLPPTWGRGLARQRRSPEPLRAYKDDFFKIKLPRMTEKPEWWWRTLACVPYLIALQISDVGYYLQPFLENHEVIGDMIYFIPGAIRRWPSWFFMVYCYMGYMWIVKNRELAHYFRFHVMMGMLLETGLQIIWCGSNFFPLIHFNGRLGMYYWATIGFTYICLLLECVRCALGGMYVHIPFVSDAALIHTLFNLGGFQRPLR